MTDAELTAYCQEQLATIAAREVELRTELHGLAYARQAYRDVIAERARRRRGRDRQDDLLAQLLASVAGRA